MAFKKNNLIDPLHIYHDPQHCTFNVMCVCECVVTVSVYLEFFVVFFSAVCYVIFWFVCLSYIS